MKHILFSSILFFAIAMPSFAALTDADLDKIRLIVNDSEKRVKEDIKTEIESSEKGMKEYINTKIDGVDKQFVGVNKQITLLTNVVYGLIALIVAAVAIPQIIMAWRSGKDNRQDEQITREQTIELIEELIRNQEQQIETLTQEIAELRQQPILSTGTEL